MARSYQAIIPIVFTVALVITVVVTYVVVANVGPRAEVTLPPDTTAAPTTTGPTTPPPTTTPAPPSVIPACPSPTREATIYNHTLVLPSNVSFTWNVLPMDVTQSFLNGTQIMTDPITSAVLHGERYIVASPNDMRLYTLGLDGETLTQISAWQFANVFGFIIKDSYLYTLTDTNELLKLLLGPTYAIILERQSVSHPAKYLTINPGTQVPHVLLVNGTIATLNVVNAQVQSVCTPAESGYENIGFDVMNRLVGTIPFFIDSFPMGSFD